MVLMSPLRSAIISLLLLCSGSVMANAQISPQMHDGIAGVKPVPLYSTAERTAAIQELLKLAAPPELGAPVSLTPNAPYARGGAHLSFWKPSFVLGTASGGEAGFNFWSIYNQGHVNVGFTAGSTKSYAIDCRVLSAGNISYKIYAGDNGELREQGDAPLQGNHFLLAVPVSSAGEPISVEIWPAPVTATMGFLGCDLATINPHRHSRR